MTQPASPTPAGAPAAPKTSSIALAAIAAISFIVLASIYGFILFVSGMMLTAQLWWMGVCSLVFALVFYFVFAATHDSKIMRPVTAAFFVIGVASFYASIATNSGESAFLSLVWIVLLSVFVVIVLFWVYWMSRQEERDAVRRSQRRLTP